MLRTSARGGVVPFSACRRVDSVRADAGSSRLDTPLLGDMGVSENRGP